MFKYRLFGQEIFRAGSQKSFSVMLASKYSTLKDVLEYELENDWFITDDMCMKVFRIEKLN